MSWVLDRFQIRRYSSRINFDIDCPMDFHKFPFDKQVTAPVIALHVITITTAITIVITIITTFTIATITTMINLNHA